MNGWSGPVGRGVVGLHDPARPRKTLPPIASPSKLKFSTMLHNRRSGPFSCAACGLREGPKENLPWDRENRPEKLAGKPH